MEFTIKVLDEPVSIKKQTQKNIALKHFELSEMYFKTNFSPLSILTPQLLKRREGRGT